MIKFKRSQNGFTLIELMVVIVVIGILVGILIPTVGPLFKRSTEFAIQSEVLELQGAIEHFKTKYGFYPPSYIDDVGSDWTVAPAPPGKVKFLSYLRKISPNHNETDANINNWWDEVGQDMDEASLLVFWLSGLRASAEFPLTDNGTIVDAFSFGDDVAQPRRVLFKFEDKRLITDATEPRIATFLQRKAIEQPYIYFDANNYNDGMGTERFYTTNTGINVYPYAEFAGPPIVYYNPRSFQIIAAGNDRSFSEVSMADSTDWNNAAIQRDHRDNITNFAEGIMEKKMQ